MCSLKKICLLAGLVAGTFFLQTAEATVTMPYYDAFNYSEGNLISVSGGNWILGNGSSTFEIAVSNSAALTSPAGFPASSAKGVRRAPSGSARRAVVQYTSVPNTDGNTVYASFLLNIQTAPGGTELIGYLDNNSTSQGSPQGGIFVTSGPKIGVGKKSSSPGFTIATNLNAGTHLVVERYTFLASGNDRVELWVDPDSSTYGAGTAPAALGGTTGASDPVSLDFFQLSTSSGAGSVMFIDEFRVGTAWADVVPSGGPVIGTKLGFTTQPADTAVNATMSPVVVQVQDAGNVSVSSNAVPVTLTLSSGSGTLSGTLTQNTDSSGKATFSDLSVDTAGTGKQLTASASGIGAGLASAVSGAFAITSGGGGGGGGTGTNPAITLAQMKAAGFAVTGTNAVPNAFGQIFGSPDLALPLTNWILVNYGNFDANGNIIFTNPVSPALPNAYYFLQTGDTGTKIEAPGFVSTPGDLTVAAGQTATFSVSATGPLLRYLWLFSGGPLSVVTTNTTLTISNAQAGNAGTYSIIVANPAGYATATVNLRVGNYAPTIVTQPQGQTIVSGGTAIFSVVADGTQPLSYQWYHNTNTPVANATNAVLNLNNVQTNDAGTYLVKVSNNINFINSTNAPLFVNAVPTNLPDTNMIGFAALAGVTGGAGGTIVLATNYLSFSNYVRQVSPLIIQITNPIIGPGPGVDEFCYVYGNNKTIIGVGTNAQIDGVDLRINATNIIVQNILFQVTPVGTNDAITVDGGSKGTGKYVWIDHCTISNAQDGSIDFTKGADYATVSWCKFVYGVQDPAHVHEFVHLIGSSDSDNASQFHITLHHNWYGTNAVERMPSVRFGRVHVFNCYYNCTSNHYCARTRISAQVLVENNFYQGVQNPWELYTTSGTTGLLLATNNNVNYLDTSYGVIWKNGWTSGQSLIPGTNSLSDFSPVPYIYTNALHAASDVPYYVQTYSGAGKYPFAP